MNTFKNFSNTPTITVGKEWSLLDNDSKIEQITFQINEFNKNKLNIKVVSADNKGQVIIALHENMPARERGIFFLERIFFFFGLLIYLRTKNNIFQFSFFYEALAPEFR